MRSGVCMPVMADSVVFLTAAPHGIEQIAVFITAQEPEPIGCAQGKKAMRDQVRLSRPRQKIPRLMLIPIAADAQFQPRFHVLPHF